MIRASLQKELEMGNTQLMAIFGLKFMPWLGLSLFSLAQPLWAEPISFRTTKLMPPPVSVFQPRVAAS